MNEIIKTMARVVCAECAENPDHRGDARGNEYRWQDYRGIAIAALRAAKAEGWELVSLPHRVTASMAGDAEYAQAYNACLDDILRLELEEGDG